MAISSMIALTAASAYTGYKQTKATESAANEAKQNALKQEAAADQANNRANQKKPNTQAIMDAAAMAGKGGVSGTMLTGPSGVDPNALNLGRNTLLGG